MPVAGSNVGSLNNNLLGTISLKDIEAYLKALPTSATGPTPADTPYTFGVDDDGTFVQEGQLTTAQLNQVLGDYGFSSTQVAQIDSGAGSSWITNALQGLTGGLAAVGPEGADAGDLLDLLGIGGKVSEITPADDAPDTAPEGEANSGANDDSTTGSSDDASPSSPASKLPSLGTGAGLAAIWEDIAGDAKYAAIWVGLAILGISLIVIGLTRRGRAPATPSIVPVA
jgi:hypothetical protein